MAELSMFDFDKIGNSMKIDVEGEVVTSSPSNQSIDSVGLNSTFFEGGGDDEFQSISNFSSKKTPEQIKAENNMMALLENMSPEGVVLNKTKNVEDTNGRLKKILSEAVVLMDENKLEDKALQEAIIKLSPILKKIVSRIK